MDSDNLRTPVEEPTKGKSPQAPRSRSRSNSRPDRQASAPLPMEQQQHDDYNIGSSSNISNMTTKKEAPRRRSKTLGSLESDLYNKRNSSLVRTIGSMVLLKSSVPSPATSDEESITRPSTPPKAAENDTVDSYLERLINEGFEFEAASILAEKNSQFHKDCLYKFISNKFDFTRESLDISLRKMLTYCELPKESQHIDRFIECFGRCYYACNKDLWDSADQVYFLTFSFVMLHTDHFNLDNKKKMAKDEFVKNTRVEDPESNLSNSKVPREVLEYFYDNITYCKFSNVLHQNQSSRPASLYMLPKRMFSNSTTYLSDSAQLNSAGATAAVGSPAPSVNGSTPINQQNAPQIFSPGQQNQPPNPPPRSMSISSSTSQFFNLTSSWIDPYQFIVNNSVDAFNLQLDGVNSENPFKNKLCNHFSEAEFIKYYNILKTADGGTFIRFNKAFNWISTTKTEVKRVDTEGEEFVKTNSYLSNKVLLKIIKVRELYKEELNSKFLSLGSSTKTSWKRHYGILTTCGFFLFENLNFLSFRERERIFNNDSIVVEVPDSVLKSCLKYSISGLFAVETEQQQSHHHPDEPVNLQLPRYTFNIFSTNKKEVFSTLSSTEMSSWIMSINLVASLDNCHLEFDDFQDLEIVPIRNILITDKIEKLNKNSKLSEQKTRDLLKTVDLLKTLAPFSTKTRDNLMSYFHLLNVRIDWLWYEIERNQVYIDILNKFQQVFRVMETKLDHNAFLMRQLSGSLHSSNRSNNTVDNDGGSILEDSFINEENNAHTSPTIFDDISTVDFLQRSDDDDSSDNEPTGCEEDGTYQEDENNGLFDNELEEFVTSLEVQ